MRDIADENLNVVGAPPTLSLNLLRELEFSCPAIFFSMNLFHMHTQEQHVSSTFVSSSLRHLEHKSLILHRKTQGHLRKHAFSALFSS